MSDAMPITPELVTWARERAGFSLGAATLDFRLIAEWEAGIAFPSYPQIEKMAEKFKVPVAVFFFPEPPDLPEIEETFRTMSVALFDAIPPRIRWLLRKARTFQMSLEELHSGRNPTDRLITRNLAFSPADPTEEIAAEVRSYIGIGLDQQSSWGNVEIALKEWRKALREIGVYVFKDQFRDEGYSGFCLYHDEFPIIYANNTNSKTRQIFTLFHELAHLLFHTSGIDSEEDNFIEHLEGENKRIEVICNRMAAHFLVPEEAFDLALSNQEPNEATAVILANHFSVSREFIFRKFLDRNMVTQSQYEQAARRWSQQKKSGAGGDHYNTKIAYLGDDFINLAFQRYYENKINYAELAEILDTKPKNLSKLEDYFSRRNP